MAYLVECEMADRGQKAKEFQIAMAQFTVQLREITARTVILDAMWKNAVVEGNGRVEEELRAELISIYDMVFTIRIEMITLSKNINS